MANLLNNAAKYAGEGGRIQLTVEAGPGVIAVRVRDDGIGMPGDLVPHVFELFATGKHNGSDGGLGIGLPLVRRLVEMHGGTLRATSPGRGRGSEFVVRLPLLADAESDAAEAPASASPAQPRALRLLVVDDNRDAADSLGMLLEMIGNEVRMAHDGLEAVRVAAEFHPDVVLLDLGLPKLSGYEAARWIREQDGGKRVLLVALTGWGQEEDRRRTREAGFDHHLTKPVEWDALRRLLAESLELAREGDGNARPAP